MMKKSHLLCLGIMLGMPIVSTAQSFDPGTLGHMKAVLDSCGRVNPQKASQYLLQMKAVIGGATKSEINQPAKTQEYQAAYQSVHEKLGGLTQEGVAAQCESYLSAN